MSIQVLVLEDRQADAELCVKELEKAGFRVDWQRVETLRDFRLRLTPNLDLILADYALPGFDATDALGVYKEARLDVPLIVVSGTVGEERAVECLTLGATDYVLKDRLARLGPATHRALSERDSRRRYQRSQDALARSEEQMRGILGTIEDVVWSVSLDDRRLLYLNPAAGKLTGRPAEQFLENPELVLLHVHPDDQAKMARAPEEAVRWGAYEAEFRLVRTDGTMRDVLARAWAAYSEAGKPVRLEGIFTDVTDRREAERERGRAKANLVEAERLKQLSDFKTQFLDMVAHDLNNVLTPMSLNLELVGDDLQRAGQADSKALQRLRHCVKRMAFFLADLLDASRLQSGRLTIHARTYDLASSIRDTLDGFTHEARAQGVRVESHVPLQAIVWGDAQRIEQVITNLLSNALKFTPAGGIVTVKLDQQDDGSVEVRVKDTGPGIAPEAIEKLFQPFTRLSATPQGKHTGTGLGLFISRGIVEGHGGRISCESEGLGKGATFRFTLPGASLAEA